MNDRKGSAAEQTVEHEVVADAGLFADGARVPIDVVGTQWLPPVQDLAPNLESIAVAEDDGGAAHGAIVVHGAVGRSILVADDDFSRVGGKLGKATIKRDPSPAAEFKASEEPRTE